LIYLDTSVLLAQLLAEDRKPPADLWKEPLLSSRLLEYEVWCRLHARHLEASHGEAARQLLGRISFLELSPETLGRALDALHLASIEFLRGRRLDVRLATYDRRMTTTASSMAIPLVPLP